MVERERWSNRYVFIMAAIGSAIGLGNMWRFPYIAAQNGGGAFLLPYFVALISFGIPMLMLEYGLGVFKQQSISKMFMSLRKPFLRPLGWIPVMSAFMIVVYYHIVLAWIVMYLVKGKVSEWGATLESSSQYFTEMLNLSKGPWDGFWSLQIGLVIALMVIWFLNWMVVQSGLKMIGKIVMYSVPLPLIFLIIIIIRGVTLNSGEMGASLVGFNYYLTPQWDKLFDYKVWMNAYSQIFFSLSVGFAVMVAYASFMPKDTEVPNSACITSFSNCLFSFLAGFAVFSILGYFAVATHQPIEQLAKAGPSLAFVVYPTALANLPLGNIGINIFAFLFFATLFLLGLDSAYSIIEAVVCSLSDHFDFSRRKSTTIVSIVGFTLGLPMVSSAGLYWLDIVDHYILNYMLIVNVLLQCCFVAWAIGVKPFREFLNKNADIKLNALFDIVIKYFVPIFFLILMALNIFNHVKQPYGGYPWSALLAIGGGAVAFCFVLPVILYRLEMIKNKK